MTSWNFDQARAYFREKGFYFIANVVVKHHMRKDFEEYDVTQDRFFILPVGKDFIFVKKNKTGLNTKLLGSIADVVGTSASMVGFNSGNLKTISDASKVINTANTVSYGANAIDQIQNLPISNESKKIAGKNMEIIDWTFTDDGYIIIALFEKKKYEIYLQEAVMAGEVKL